MDRRSFLRKVGVGGAFIALEHAGMGASRAAASPASHPNLLIIHTDQLSSWAISAYAKRLRRVPNYGKVLVETPHIDSLATEGVLLENFFTNSAVCTPSRGCLVTGRYPHAHGAYRNNIEMNRDEVTIARVLQRQGYETGYAGKWHLDGPPKPGWLKPDRSMGFADCRFMFNRGHWKKIEDRPGSDPEAHPYRVIGDRTSFTTDWLANKTIDFISKRRSTPFFYLVSIPDPHTPFTVREPYMSMYDPEDMIVPHTFQPSAEGQRKGATEERLRRNKAHYCGQVKCIDDNVGRILRVLREKGLLDHTVVVFTTDHGEYMGEHRLYGKNQWYRTAYQIPFLVRWPKRIRGATAVEEFVTNVDVQQTLLGLMGIPPCGREQGRDASGLLRGQSVDWKNEAMIHHSSLESAGVFTPEYELVLKGDGKHMFFDRVNDPEQTRNLHGDKEHKATFDTLKQRIVQHHEEVKSPARTWLAKL